jgi:hypothetical protein
LWSHTFLPLPLIAEKRCGLRIETAVLIKTRSQKRDTENYLGDLGVPGATGMVSVVARYLSFLTEIFGAGVADAEKAQNVG